MSPAIKLLRELIGRPSVNPAFLPPGNPHGGEHRVADFLAAEAAKLGLEVERQPVLPGRLNLIVRLTPPAKCHHRILLAPHLDTVGGSPLSDTLFHPRLRQGRIHGRGACDTKGSVAAMFAALSAVARNGPRPSRTEIRFVGLVDEENGQAGSRAFSRRGERADLAIVGEPTRLAVVTAHKGDLWLALETRGRSAHGATPDLGRNAVHAMARIVDLLQTQYAAQLRQKQHRLLGCATVNVGSIAGGTQPNIVPDQCRITIDRRTLPGESERAVRREITTLLRGHKLAARFQNLRTAPCPALETDWNQALIQRLLSLVGQRKPVGVHYFCDAAVLAEGGIPSVVFGPGDIAQAHTADEWVAARSVERATDLLTRFLRSLP